jgi:2-keto-4-pentenoate hydratase/2-oxohepta-3-ene-1,7-dioic acid hydratase in catechol pathway
LLGKGELVFRLINVGGRAAFEKDGRYFDLATLSGDDQMADALVAVERFEELGALYGSLDVNASTGSLDDVVLGAPIPFPRQVFGIGLNYHDHVGETSAQLPPAPLTFTKYPTCIVGPTSPVELSGDNVDWEVELVAVIGKKARALAPQNAWDYVAGLTLGQDISDRVVQRTGVPPQFSLGKSFATFGPTGPALVSLDAFADPFDIELWCEVDGERMQHARSSLLIFSIPTLVAYLSSIVTLLPGDLIFTGTPSGVGAARGRFLKVGETLHSGAEVIGTMTNVMVAGSAPLAL